MPVTPAEFLARASIAVSLANGPITSGAISNFMLPPLDLTEALGGLHISDEANDVRVADTLLNDLSFTQHRDAVSSGDTVRGLTNFWLNGNPGTAGVRSGENLYYTRALTDGKVLFSQRNLKTHKVVSRVLVANWAASDHNTGAVFDLNRDGRIGIIASEHSQNGFLAWRMTRPHDMDSIGDPVDLKTAMGLPSQSSYAQVFFSPLFPGRTFCLFRTTAPTWTRLLSWSDSPDLSVWATPVTLITSNGVNYDRPYPVITYDTATDRLYILFSRDNPEDIYDTSGNQIGGEPNNVPLYAGYLQFAPGAHTGWTVRTMTGTSLGAFGTAVLNLTNATNAWQVADRVAWPWHAFMCAGQPAFIIGSTNATDERVQEMRVLRWNGSAFAAVTLPATVTTAADDYYPAGACSADGGQTIYACTASNGALPGPANQRVVKYVTTDNWATAPTPTELERHAGMHVRFVWVPDNADGLCPLVVDSGYFERITQKYNLFGRGQVPLFFGRKGVVIAPVVPSLPVDGNAVIEVFAGKSGLAAGNSSPDSTLVFDWAAPTLGRSYLGTNPATFFQNIAQFSIEFAIDIYGFDTDTDGAGSDTEATDNFLLSGWDGTRGGPIIRYRKNVTPFELNFVVIEGTTNRTVNNTNLTRPGIGRHYYCLNYSTSTGAKIYHNGVAGNGVQSIAANYMSSGAATVPLIALWGMHGQPDQHTFGRLLWCRVRTAALGSGTGLDGQPRAVRTVDEILAMDHMVRAKDAIQIIGRNSFGSRRPQIFV